MKKMMGLMPGMGGMTRDAWSDVDAEGDMQRMVGIIDSMTPEERRNPEDHRPEPPPPDRRGAGVEPQEVNQLVKQFDMMAPLMKSMAGKGMRDRMKAISELQQSGMFNPGGHAARRRRAPASG